MKKETQNASANLADDEKIGNLEDSERILKSTGLVKNYVITSMSLGLVPVPIFDLVALVGIQVKMVHGLAKDYDVPFKQEAVKSLVISLLSGAAGVGGVLGMASLGKSFPVIGSFIGGATVSVLSGALTYAVGRVFIQHFEQGGTLLNFDPKAMREHFKRELKEGKEVVKSLKDKVTSATSKDTSTTTTTATAS